MKSIKFLICISFISSFIIACYKEDAIVPTSAANSEKFTFPQGNETRDLLIKDIYDEFGVRVIYKNFKLNDFSITWTNPAGGRIGYDVAVEHQDKAVNFIKDHIFDNLTPEITKSVLPPYFYLGDSIADYTLYPGILEAYSPVSYVYNGLDFWAFSWNGFLGYLKDLSTGEISMNASAPMPPDNSFSIFYKRGVVLKEIFKRSVNNGNISVPEDFSIGFDFVTATNAIVGNDNHTWKRGFPGQFTSATNFNISNLGRVTSTSEKQNFIDYIQLCMRYTPDSIALRYPPAQYPLIHAKYPIVIDYMKNKYNIDLNKIATKPQI